MKQPVFSVRGSARSVVVAEVAAVVAALGLIMCGVGLPVAIGVGAGLAVLLLVVTVRGLSLWQWMVRVVAWLRERRHRIELGEFSDVQVDGSTLGVLVEGHTVVTLVSVWGKSYMPTLLKPLQTDTPNTLPLSVIAKEMRQADLGVDVDVLCEGRRTSSDSYAEVYSAFLGSRSAVGQRSTTLVVRLDAHAADTTGGLLWRRNSVAAAAAATQRIVKALRQNNCRAEILNAAQMREAAAAGVGGIEVLGATFTDRWTALHQPGHGFVTSYFFSAADLTGPNLDAVWSYNADHTALVVALRRNTTGVSVSALVRYTTIQPITTTPGGILNRFTGRQWDPLLDTLPGARRLTGLPSIPVDVRLDQALSVGPSGVLVGGVRDAVVLMPLSDPQQPTRVAVNAQSDVLVRQLIRRSAAAGEVVAVYDHAGQWEMTSASSRIWSTRNMAAQPPRPPTMVVHNGRSNPYPGAWISVAVRPAPDYDPDVTIDQAGNTIRLTTDRFSVELDAITFRNEQPFLT